MELHQLRYFLAVVDEGTFTAAAQAVRVSQSGVSTQVQKLERELGLTLIDRSGRRPTLTPAGARLVPQARAALAAVDEVAGIAGEIRGLLVGSLRVGTVTGLVWDPLFDALATMHEQHPGVDIRLREGESVALAQQVREGALDLGVLAWADAEPEGLVGQVVFDDPLVAVVGLGHPWAARSAIRPRELAQADLITLAPGSGARTALAGVLGRAGGADEVRWEVATPVAVHRLAARGLGVGVVSATTAAGWPEVVRLSIEDPRARTRLGVVWRPGPTHAAQALLSDLFPAEGSGDAQSVR